MSTIIYLFHLLNECLAFVLSISSNTLLLFLIQTYTTRELRAYSQVLLQTCCVDMFFTIIGFITKLQAEFNDGVWVMWVSGFLSSLTYPYNYFLMMIWVFGFIFCLVALPIPFFYRYLLVCKGKILSIKIFIILYLIAAIFAFCIAVYTGNTFIFTDETLEIGTRVLNISRSWWEDENGRLPLFIASSVTNIKFIGLIVLAFILPIGIYGSILFFLIKIRLRLLSTKHVMSMKMNAIHSQFTNTLIAQALSPLITTIIPLTIAVSGRLLKIRTTGVGLAIVSMVIWVTVINPISAILFVEPYRKAILTFIGIGHNKIRMQVGGTQQIAFVDTYEMRRNSRPDRPSTQLKDFIVRKDYLGITGFGGMDDLEIRNGRVRRQAWMEDKMFY